MTPHGIPFRIVKASVAAGSHHGPVVEGEEPQHLATDTCSLTNTSGCSAPMTGTSARGTYAGIRTPGTVTTSPRNVSIPYPTGTASGDLVLVGVNHAGRGASISKGFSRWATIDKPRVDAYIAVAIRR